MSHLVTELFTVADFFRSDFFSLLLDNLYICSVCFFYINDVTTITKQYFQIYVTLPINRAIECIFFVILKQQQKLSAKNKTKQKAPLFLS